VESCAQAEVVVSRTVRAPTSRVRNGFITFSSPAGQMEATRDRQLILPVGRHVKSHH
jgi:hypothetical protein